MSEKGEASLALRTCPCTHTIPPGANMPDHRLPLSSQVLCLSAPRRRPRSPQTLEQRGGKKM